MTRHLKIFISSTFNDMEEEREELLKKVFVKLKKEAKQRSVEITEIDLRWGITEEDANSGQTVKICLDEIERCQDSPIFFLGMLGNRYGWNEWIDSIDKSILEDNKYSWIEEHKDVSITELEIMSALERNDKYNKAFIYLKNEHPDENIKLVELKRRVANLSKKNEFLELNYYDSHEDFREKVEVSLFRELDTLFPKDETMSELEQLRLSHKIFAQSREKVYVTHIENENKLNKFMKSDVNSMLLYGASGLGKSALIANYFKKFKIAYPNYFVIEHYIGGAGASSSDFYEMIKRVMLEIKKQFNIEKEIPNDSQNIIEEFAYWLNKVIEPTVIIFDGYNQLEEEMKEKLFYYLPQKMGLVKLIISSIEDEYTIPYKEQIEPLNYINKKKFVTDYFTGYAKNLDIAIVEEIVSHEQTNNTLFLKTIMNEIRLIGSFDTLEKEIKEYIESKNIIELFSKIFDRFQDDYEENYPNLTREVLSLLYFSRDGLSENNLMEILGVKRLEFSTLFLAIEEHLIDRNGLYGFFHDYIREAVKAKYLTSDIVRNSYRRMIVDYFEEYEIDMQKVRELPFLLFELQDRQLLYNNLMKVEFFIKLQDLNEYELSRYFEFVDEQYHLADDLTEKVLKEEKNSEIINNIGYFFHLTYTNYKNALLLFKKVLTLNKDNPTILLSDYNNLGGLYTSMGRYKRSFVMHNRALTLSLKFFGKAHLDTAICYNSLGFVYESCEKFDEALELYQKALVIREDILGENHPETAILYNNVAGIYAVIAEYQKALKLYEKAFSITTKTLGKNHLDNSTHHNNIAWINYTRGEYKKALLQYEIALKISIDSIGEKHPSTLQSYDNLASCYLQMGQYQKALSIFKRTLRITQEVFGKEHLETAITMGNIATTYYGREEYEKGILLAKEALKITKKSLGKYSDTTATKYNNLALFYIALKDYNKALALYKTSLEISIKVRGDNHPDTAISYNNLAGLYESKEEYTLALPLYKKALKIYEEVFGENHPDTAMLYNNLAYLYDSMNRLEDGLELYKRAYDIEKEFLGDEHPDVIGIKQNIMLIKGKMKPCDNGHYYNNDKYFTCPYCENEILDSNNLSPITQCDNKHFYIKDNTVIQV